METGSKFEEAAQKKRWQNLQRDRLDKKRPHAYVYVHVADDFNAPFYVGMGETISRPWNLKNRTNFHNHIQEKHGIRVSIVLDCVEKNVAKWWEVRWIAALKKEDYRLANLTPGGDANPMDLPEIREKQRRNVPRGEGHSSKTLKVKEVLRLKNLGKTYSPEVNAKKGRTGKKVTLTDQGRKILQSPRSELTKIKMSSSAAVRNLNEDYLKSLSEGARQMHQRRNADERSAIASKGWETRRRNTLKDK